MPREHGFKFTIKGEVFVRQKSNSGVDIVAAFEEANEIRAKIRAALQGVPTLIKTSEPVGASRLVVAAKVAETPPDDDAADDPPAEDGPTPALDLPSRRKRGAPAAAAE